MLTNITSSINEVHTKRAGHVTCPKYKLKFCLMADAYGVKCCLALGRACEKISVN